MSAPNKLMENTAGKDAPRTADARGLRISVDANAAEVAEAVAAMWRDIDAVMRPVLGQRGVVALFKRSVHLTSAAHPWLASVYQDRASVLDLPALEALFSLQTGAAALACGNALQLTFHQLLASLIGESLTERLLHSVWARPDGEAPTQDPSS